MWQGWSGFNDRVNNEMLGVKEMAAVESKQMIFTVEVITAKRNNDLLEH